MRIIGIIAEYNPLHYGHEYQLTLAKESFNADAVVVVMSGNFTPRGTPAILDKNIRAELAIKDGADLVVELPSYYSSGLILSYISREILYACMQQSKVTPKVMKTTFGVYSYITAKIISVLT